MNMKSNADRLVGPCNSLDELAAAMDVPADTLKATFETYDAMVAAGEDTEFGKKLFLQSLSAPYYAMKHFPYRYKTHGGMKITTDSQLTDKDGNPIPTSTAPVRPWPIAAATSLRTRAAASSPAKP